MKGTMAAVLETMAGAERQTGVEARCLLCEQSKPIGDFVRGWRVMMLLSPFCGSCRSGRSYEEVRRMERAIAGQDVRLTHREVYEFRGRVIAHLECLAGMIGTRHQMAESPREIAEKLAALPGRIRRILADTYCVAGDNAGTEDAKALEMILELVEEVTGSGTGADGSGARSPSQPENHSGEVGCNGNGIGD